MTAASAAGAERDGPEQGGRVLDRGDASREAVVRGVDEAKGVARHPSCGSPPDCAVPIGVSPILRTAR
jgi:hypothetical protein